MNILSFLSGLFVALSSIIGIHKPIPSQVEVLSIEATIAPSETPLPTEEPTPTTLPNPTKVPVLNTDSPKPTQGDLQEQINELKKQVNSIPKPKVIINVTP